MAGVKIMIRYILPVLLILASASAEAGIFYDLTPHTSSATMKLSGVMKIAASTSTPNTAVITLDGANSLITAPAISISGNSAAATGSFSGLLSLNGTQSIKFTSGGGYYVGFQSFLDGGKPGIQLYDTSTYNNTAAFKLGGLYAPVLYGSYPANEPLLGLNNSAPTVALDVTGGIKASSITASAGFYGDGSNLTGITPGSTLSSSNTWTGTNTFVSVSTTSFSAGWVDYGITQATATASQLADAICPAGSYVIGGGGTANGACGQYSSYAFTNTTWRTQCGEVVSMSSYAICARVKPF